MGIRKDQFEALKARGQKVGCNTGDSVEMGKGLNCSVLLGVDPSLRGTGYGVVRLENRKAISLDHGQVSCPKGWTKTRCLASIHSALTDQIQKHHPTICVVEGLFFAQNMKTALIMGEARGAALAAVASHGIPIYELSPRKVKQAVVGYGAAQKDAVAKMVQRILNLSEQPDPDAADALALALAFAQAQQGLQVKPPKPI